MDFQVKLDGVWYSLDTINQQATVINSQDRDYEGEFVIPSSLLYKGVIYNVLKIGDEAFFCCYNLATVIISEGVIDIGFSAFDSCTELQNISLPKSLLLLHMEGAG